MGAHDRRRSREATGGMEPFIGRACACCGSATVVAPCRECGDWFVVCDCFDERVAIDRFVNTDGRCASCRRWSDDDERDARLLARLARRTRRG